jgi:hypothetical protein
MGRGRHQQSSGNNFSGFSLALVHRWRGWRGFGVWVPGSGVSGRGQCRVAAFWVSGLRASDVFFITISHCAWRRVISFSKAKKKRSKENAFTALP